MLHDVRSNNGVELERFERIYSMLIEDTLKRLPKLKIVLLEPFVLKGDFPDEEYEKVLIVKEYAKTVKKIAEKYGLYFIPLQKKLEDAAAQCKDKVYLYDGIHPNVAGATLIAQEWMKFFNGNIK